MTTTTGLLHWTATTTMQQSSLRPLAQPLPRLSPLPVPPEAHTPFPRPTHNQPSSSTTTSPSLPSHTELLTIGAGPAGLLAHLLLTRYGLRSPLSALCIDASPTPTLTGHADGIFARTMEILRSLGLEGEIEREALWVREMAGWRRCDAADGEGKGGPGLKRERVSTVDSGNGRYRYGLCRSLHQGRVEGVLLAELRRFEGMGVRRGWRCVGVRVEEEAKGEGEGYPVVATLRQEVGEGHGEVVEVRAKYVIGGDGAHSSLRRALGIAMEGSTSDDVYGVIDFVPDSNFPDIRRQSSIVTEEGTILHIPREARANGDRAVRLYVPFGSIDQEASTELPIPEEVVINGEVRNGTQNGKVREDGRMQVTVDKIFERANAIFAPYYVKPKDIPGCIEWWAAYRVGQRLSAVQSWPPVSPGETKRPRVFLVGDAAHTHTPKIGQGMNVSMQDSYNLAWKLASVVLGLVPPAREVELLRSYEDERRPIAEELLNLDTLWYSKRYKAIDLKQVPGDMLLGAVLDFCSGITLEYVGGTLLVGQKSDIADIEELQRLKKGLMRAGRRMPDIQLKRFADGVELSLHEECPSTGRWRLLAFTTDDLAEAGDTSAILLTKLCELVTKFVERCLELTVLHCKEHMSFEWTVLPSMLKTMCEMRLYQVQDDGYEMLGIEKTKGKVVIVRPDGVVAVVLSLEDSALIELEVFLSRVLIPR